MHNSHKRKEEKMATATQKAKKAGETKVVYLNLPADIAAKLLAESVAEDRPMSVQAARIIAQYYEAKGGR